MEQYVPLLKQPDWLKFDVIVDDAPTSRDMKERTWAATMQLLPVAQQMGFPIPPEIVEYAPFPSSLLAKWKQLIAQTKQPNPTQQAMEQLSVQQAAADVEKTQATADKEQTAATLNAVKAQVESLQPMIQQIQMFLSAFAPAPGPGGMQPPQMPPQMPQQPPMQPAPMGAPAPTPFQ
jgi:hypothetical protein